MANYTRLTDDEMRDILALYDRTALGWNQMDGGALNTSYLVNCGNERFVLTVLDNQVDLSPEILASLLLYLHERGVRTSEPIRNSTGGLISTFGDHRILLKRFVAGQCGDELSRRHLFAAGKALATLHQLPPPTFLPNLTRRLSESSARLDSIRNPKFLAWIRTRLSMIDFRSVQTPMSIAHGDYFADNVVVMESGDLAILDFETASVDVPILDIGFAAVGLCRRDGKLEPDRLRLLLDGYQSVRQLQPTELGYLRNSIIHAAAKLAFDRYIQYHIRLPEPAKQHSYEEMTALAERAEADWRDPVH